MRDTVADQVAEKIEGLILTLQGMGLRRASIIKGLEIGLDRARDGEPPMTAAAPE